MAARVGAPWSACLQMPLWAKTAHSTTKLRNSEPSPTFIVVIQVGPGRRPGPWNGELKGAVWQPAPTLFSELSIEGDHCIK